MALTRRVRRFQSNCVFSGLCSVACVFFAACGDATNQVGSGTIYVDASVDLDAANATLSATQLPIVLRNEDPGECSEDGVFAQPMEVGHYAASRLTPSSYPFLVEEIGYRLQHEPHRGAQCNASLPHRVIAFRSGDPSPPAKPEIDAEFNVVESQPNAPIHEVRRALSSPIRIEEGQHFYIAFQYSAAAPGGLCLSSCVDTDAADRNFWSNASMAPFPWSTLASFGLPNSFTVFAGGRSEVDGSGAR